MNVEKKIMQKLRTSNVIENEDYLVSDSLVISVIMAIIAVGLLTTLILMIPKYPFQTTNPNK
ncbi:MAG: hypothetical protein JXA54_09385 [Candidatus Heimdallarchaeota archaeon]|nr:hypothetical protein [Candidatus Heimdallarchaeota archaeon]